MVYENHAPKHCRFHAYMTPSRDKNGADRLVSISAFDRHQFYRNPANIWRPDDRFLNFAHFWFLRRKNHENCTKNA